MHHIFIGQCWARTGPLQPCELQWCPFFRRGNRSIKGISNILQGHTLSTWRDTVCSQVRRPQSTGSPHYTLIGILFPVALVWSPFSFLARISFWPGSYNVWATLKSSSHRMAALSDSEKKTLSCPVLCKGAQHSTQPGGQGLINEEPYWRHLGPLWFKITLHPIKTENPQNCDDPIKPLTQRE